MTPSIVDTSNDAPGKLPSFMEDLLYYEGLADLYEKVQAGERLTISDGLRLYHTPQLGLLALLADIVRRRKVGEYAFFNRNLRIDYTNICNKKCLFCAFDRLPGEPGGYVLEQEDIVERIRAARAYNITEVHMVGGINPRLPFTYYLDLLRWVKSELPNVHVKAFTMVELEQIIKVSKLTPEETLLALREAGLDSCPGGGAEVLSDRVRKELYPLKIGPARWLELQRLAHRCGLRTTATMLYGHVETVEERLEHMAKLRELQDETGGFQAFVPLAFHPENTELAHLPMPSGCTDLRTIAVSRLMLDNFDHIKAYWVMLTPKLAQVALAFGADDLDGTVINETIVHEAGAQTPLALSVDELVALIREAGRKPAERDSLYRILREWE
ncbi:MAG: aminofutalosine synthase MqnE [Candidatus Sumerlaea chitinivorans]|nr:aminofutalosine synthase MqnE [Candidatus Sumerlaea chitinivorans]